MAILSSDARQVLHHSQGKEPAAAQFLSQALESCTSGIPGDVRTTHSILATLLGPQMEADALRALNQGSDLWKGTVTAPLATGDATGARSMQSIEQIDSGSGLWADCANQMPSGQIGAHSTSSPAKAYFHTAANKAAAPPPVQPASAAAAEGPAVPAAEPSTRAKEEVVVVPAVSGMQGELTSKRELLDNFAAGKVQLGCMTQHESQPKALSPFLSSQMEEAASLDSSGLSVVAFKRKSLEGNVESPRPKPRVRRCWSFAQKGQRSTALLSMHSEDIDRILSSSASPCERSRTACLLRGLQQAHTPRKPSSMASSRSASHKLHVPEVPTGGLSSQATASGPLMTPGTTPRSCSGVVNDQEVIHIGTQACPKQQSDDIPLGHPSEHRSLPFSPDVFEEDEECAKQDHSGDNLDAVTHTFDIAVSRLKSADHQSQDAPILVKVCDTSEHGQAKAILSELAFSQLELMANIMPLHAIQFLAMEPREAIPENIGRLAHRHKNVTLLFMDMCGFTSFSKSVEPEEVMVLLNNLFSLFDRLTDQCKVHKLETAGDCYLVSGGVMETSADGFGTIIDESEAMDPAEAAQRVMDFAIKALEAAAMVEMPRSQATVRMRVGMHTGDCVSGLIGTKLPKFSCFGDAMNVASRMESTGVPGRIHVSEPTYQLLKHTHQFEATGGVEVKGKGPMMTYLWKPNSHNSLDSPGALSLTSSCPTGIFVPGPEESLQPAAPACLVTVCACNKLLQQM